MTESGLKLPSPRPGNIKLITQETEQGQETTGNDRERYKTVTKKKMKEQRKGSKNKRGKMKQREKINKARPGR